MKTNKGNGYFSFLTLTDREAVCLLKLTGHLLEVLLSGQWRHRGATQTSRCPAGATATTTAAAAAATTTTAAAASAAATPTTATTAAACTTATITAAAAAASTATVSPQAN